jgi:hypothetical protein
MADAQSRGWGPGWPNCQGSKIVSLTVSGTKFPSGVRAEILELVSRLVQETKNRGYRFGNANDPSYGCWGYNCRPIGGTNSPSNHSWGLAVDINAPSNPNKEPPIVTDMPPWMPDLWTQYGFRWGGTYSRPDSMHYEFMGTPQDAINQTTRARANRLGENQTSPPKPSPIGDTDLFQLWREDPDGHLYVSNGINIRWLETQWAFDNMVNMMTQRGFDTTVYSTSQETIESGQIGILEGKMPPW